MATYKLQKVRNDYGDQRDSRNNPVKFYQGAVNRIACGQDEYGAVTGLSKEQERHFEEVLNLPPKELDRNSKFWTEWNVKVGAGGKFFNDEQPQDALALIVLKQRAHIGSTLADSKKSGITYILTSEDHEAKVAIDNRTYKKKAFSHLDKMTPEDLRNYLVATNRKVAGMSPEAIEDMVGREAELDPKRFLEIALDEDRDLKVFVNELVHTGIFIKNGTAFVDRATDDIVSYGLEGTVEYFKDIKNQSYYIELQKQLAKKKKAK